MTLPIAITQGDPAGIGPEIIAKAFRDVPDVTRGCFVAGDVATMRRAAQCITGPGQVSLPVAEIRTVHEALAVPSRCIPVLSVLQAPERVPVGMISASAGRMAADGVTWAARAALRGDIAALVTAPLHKEALAAAGVHFPGHTELLQAEAAAYLGRPVSEVPVRMMLANDELRTVLVSIHVSLRDAIDAVTAENVLQTLRLTHQFLQKTAQERVGPGGQPRCRIGVAGLNPHAGEGGLFGREELDTIIPAIERARAPRVWMFRGLLPRIRCSCGRVPGQAIPVNLTW